MFENITNLKASIQSEVLGEWVFDKKSNVVIFSLVAKLELVKQGHHIFFGLINI